MDVRMQNVSLIVSLLSFLAILGSCAKVEQSFTYMQAETAYNQGDLNKAVELYKKLLEKTPNDASLHWRLGTVYFSKGEKLRVQKEIIELRKLGRDDLASDLKQLVEK